MDRGVSIRGHIRSSVTDLAVSYRPFSAFQMFPLRSIITVLILNLKRLIKSPFDQKRKGYITGRHFTPLWVSDPTGL